MGVRFRKSIKAGPVRVTFSKSGVGYSVGGKGFRVTKKAKGGMRTTASIPGTGLSYVKDYGKGQKKSAAKSRNVENRGATEKPAKFSKPFIEFYLCLFLGWAGAHKFYVKKYAVGVLYLFTFGLLGVGWIVDIIKCGCIAIKSVN